MKGVEFAISLACKVHADQVDKAGRPYILHPIRLMQKFVNENEMIVAVLHDVIEDSRITLDDLRKYGLQDQIVEAIDCLSRRQRESYEDFIVRISTNELARRVKIEDIKDNLDLTRLNAVGSDDLSRVIKYHRALRHLTKIDP
jgi:(p)ppGpp synthase/HD superfamily hydrolase